MFYTNILIGEWDQPILSAESVEYLEKQVEKAEQELKEKGSNEKLD